MRSYMFSRAFLVLMLGWLVLSSTALYAHEGGDPTRTTSFEEVPAPPQVFITSGEIRFLTIMCYPKSPQLPPVYYGEEYFAGMYPILNEYFAAISYKALDFNGDATGWYQLPRTEAQYMEMGWARNGSRQLAADCAQQAYNAGVHLENYNGLQFALDGFTSTLEGEGGFWCPVQDKCWRATWLPEWLWVNLSPVAHEVLHTLGAPHSAGVENSFQGNMYDIMSDTTVCSSVHPVYGCMPIFTIADFRRDLSWIPADHVVELRRGRHTVELNPVSGTLNGTVLVQTKALDFLKGNDYSIEVRTHDLYDSGLAHTGVIIHRIDQPRYNSRAVLMGTWSRPFFDTGDSFVDPVEELSVCIKEKLTNGGYRIEVGIGFENRCVHQVLIPIAGR